MLKHLLFQFHMPTDLSFSPNFQNDHAQPIFTQRNEGCFPFYLSDHIKDEFVTVVGQGGVVEPPRMRPLRWGSSCPFCRCPSPFRSLLPLLLPLSLKVLPSFPHSVVDGGHSHIALAYVVWDKTRMAPLQFGGPEGGERGHIPRRGGRSQSLGDLGG